MAVLVGLGERVGQRFLPKYLEALGAGAIVIGLYGALENLLGALWSLPGGILSDRLGAKRALLLFNLSAIAGYVAVALVPSWPAVLVAAAFFLAWSAVSLPATLSLIVKRMPPSQRALGVSIHSLVRRIPMAIGPVLGGLLIARFGIVTGVRLAFVVAACLALVAILVQRRMLDDEPSRYASISPFRLFREFPPGLRRLLVSDILIRFCEQIPNAFVVLWVMNVVGKSAPQFGLWSALEMATAAAIYLPVAHFSDRMERKPFVLVTFVFFTLFPAFLYFSHSSGWLTAAFILRGLKEFGEPTRKALIVEFAPKDMEARIVGAYYLVRDSIVSLAAFAGGILWARSPALNLWVAFAFGALGTLYFAIFGRGVERKA